MQSRITMADIARKAGVHATTVSLALRNHPSLPVSTRQRLQILAKEMGYRPDPALRSLVAYRRGTAAHKNVLSLAYVTNWTTQWGWKTTVAHGDFFLGASAKAEELGYRLEHFWLGEPGMTHQRMSDIIAARGITGLIIASHRYDVDTPLAFDWPAFSAVKIDFFPHEPQLHNVTNDQRAIVQLATRHVIAAGYRRIGFVMHRKWDEGVDLAWSAGFLAEQLSLAPAERIPILAIPEPSPARNLRNSAADFVVPRELFQTWFKQYRPEVLISHAPFLGSRLAEMDLSVPRDLAFVDVLLEKPDGRVAGVRQNCRRVGELGVEILAGQLQHHSFGIPEFPTATLVEGTWFDGESLPPRHIRAAAEPSSTSGNQRKIRKAAAPPPRRPRGATRP